MKLLQTGRAGTGRDGTGWAKPGWAALALFVLAACQQGPAAPAPACPNIVIVQDAAEITQFLPGQGRDLTDVTLEARIADFKGFCDTDIKDDRTGVVDVDLQLLLVTTRGPAAVTREATIKYFVAIADTEENILAREEFETSVAFEGNRNRLSFAEELIQKIPLQAGQRGDAFGVFVGFVLSDDELKYNLNKRGR
ncbi:MAG: hypothetical protein HOF99_09705 [Rhodospirillaceae bacterium]|jgi:hypothetical protein|nr:hypothetical protein [Rhodospirillaceae bacterium]MBT3809763.1 hypothetical protein [Rhodospirillaceae bacterium]MBT3930705.1 hypothetical protein [Rhodospirillaceae bacterium]MBT4772917.1 hypothetical protein [Rhodospirillaceae bacterium]